MYVLTTIIMVPLMLVLAVVMIALVWTVGIFLIAGATVIFVLAFLWALLVSAPKKRKAERAKRADEKKESH